MVPARSYEISRASYYSGYYLVNSLFVYWTFTVSGLLSQTILLNSLNQLCSPYPRWISSPGLGSSYFARHYFRNRVFFLFLWVLRCFSSPRSPPIHYFTHVWINQLFPWLEFPHSDIHGLLNICFSPWLFAAYHVFLRLLVPRHSPYALSSLTFFILNFLSTSYSSLPIHLYIFQCAFLCNFKLHITLSNFFQNWSMYKCTISQFFNSFSLYCLLIIPNVFWKFKNIH